METTLNGRSSGDQYLVVQLFLHSAFTRKWSYQTATVSIPVGQ